METFESLTEILGNVLKKFAERSPISTVPTTCLLIWVMAISVILSFLKVMMAKAMVHNTRKKRTIPPAVRSAYRLYLFNLKLLMGTNCMPGAWQSWRKSLLERYYGIDSCSLFLIYFIAIKQKCVASRQINDRYDTRRPDQDLICIQVFIA